MSEMDGNVNAAMSLSLSGSRPAPACVLRCYVTDMSLFFPYHTGYCLDNIHTYSAPSFFNRVYGGLLIYRRNHWPADSSSCSAA